MHNALMKENQQASCYCVETRTHLTTCDLWTWRNCDTSIHC